MASPRCPTRGQPHLLPEHPPSPDRGAEWPPPAASGTIDRRQLPPFPGPGETLDSIISPDLRLIQRRRGHRFGLDSLLLAAFPRGPVPGPAIDLGCGTGIISLVAARNHPGLRVVGVELQETLAALAARNVALNGMGDRVAILRADIRELDRTTRPGSFATAFANPPYRRAGTGRLCADPERATARHDLTLPLAALASALRHLLAPAGRFYLTWKPERGTELADALSREGLGITLLRPVVSRVGDPPFLLLCGGEEGMGNGPPATLPPLVVRGPGGYEAEVAHLLAHGSFPDQSPRVAIHG